MTQQTLFKANLEKAASRSSSPAFNCDSCGCEKFVDVPIHNGNSSRRDCARCGRTLGFSKWQGEHCDPQPLWMRTRAAAARSIEPFRGTMLLACFEFFVSRGDRGLTDHELAAELNMLQDTARARRHVLLKADVVRNSGRERPSPHGRASIVWTWTGKTLD